MRFPSAGELIQQALGNWRPPPLLTLSAWADEKFYLSSESAAEAGKWHTIPYQREPMDAITDPMVERMSWMKSARVGYTKAINAAVGYYIDQDPSSIMVVQPTIQDAEGYSKEEIAPMLRDVPCLRGKVREPKSKSGGNTILHKEFPGGALGMVGANSAAGFRRVSRRILLCDEIDGYPESAGPEGDPIRLAERRTEYFWNRKIIKGSTPTIAGRSAIEREFLAGDQRRYYVPCPECGEFQYLKWAQIKFPGDEWKTGDAAKKQPELIYYECEFCQAHITHDAKRAMVEAGEWRAHAPFNGHASFHIWAAYSYSPNATWANIVAEFIDARHQGVESLKTWVNTVLGETWKDKGEAPDWQRLYDRREDYPIGTVPRGALFLTAGVDVQKDRLVWEVVGWGRGKQSWSVDQGVFPGDTSSSAPWEKLDGLLSTTWEHAGGVDLRLAVLAVDSGYNTQQVYSWGRKHPMNRVMAVKGTSGAQMILGLPSPVDVNMRGRKMRRAYKVWPAGVSIAKSELYGWLRLDRPTDDSGDAYPPGYCHFPRYDAEFFKQLTAEQLVPHKNRKGYIRSEWELMPGRENHALDCRIYARVAAAACQMDRMTDANWQQLEQQLGMLPAEQPPPPDEEMEEGEPPEHPEEELPRTLPELAKMLVTAAALATTPNTEKLDVAQKSVTPPPMKTPTPAPKPMSPPKSNPAPTRRPPWIGENRKHWMRRD